MVFRDYLKRLAGHAGLASRASLAGLCAWGIEEIQCECECECERECECECE